MILHYLNTRTDISSISCATCASSFTLPSFPASSSSFCVPVPSERHCMRHVTVNRINFITENIETISHANIRITLIFYMLHFNIFLPCNYSPRGLGGERSELRTSLSQPFYLERIPSPGITRGRRCSFVSNTLQY